MGVVSCDYIALELIIVKNVVDSKGSKVKSSTTLNAVWLKLFAQVLTLLKITTYLMVVIHILPSHVK